MQTIPECAVISIGFIPVIAGLYLAVIFWNSPNAKRKRTSSDKHPSNITVVYLTKLVLLNAFFLAILYLLFNVIVMCSSWIMR